MNKIRRNSAHAWLLAARPKTLTAALVPVLMGSGLAFSDGAFQTPMAVLCLLFACTMQIAANFINDLYDYQKGTDREDRLGPRRACAEGWITPRAMRIGIGLTLLAACLCGLGLLYLSWGKLPHGGWELIAVGVTCILFAFLYTTYLSYRGWGDVLVLVFFGFVPVGGTYYVQTGMLNADVLVLSVVAGLVIDTLLMVNNYRDVEQDKISGKQTLVARLGARFGRQAYLALGIAAVLLCTWFVFSGRLSWMTPVVDGVHLGAVHLPLPAPPDVAPHVHHPQRGKAEQHTGRDFAQYAVHRHHAERGALLIHLSLYIRS